MQIGARLQEEKEPFLVVDSQDLSISAHNGWIYRTGLMGVVIVVQQGASVTFDCDQRPDSAYTEECRWVVCARFVGNINSQCPSATSLLFQSPSELLWSANLTCLLDPHQRVKHCLLYPCLAFTSQNGCGARAQVRTHTRDCIPSTSACYDDRP